MLGLVALLSLAQDDAVEHRAWLEAAAKEHGIPGLSVAVVRDGAIVLELGVGDAALDPRRPASAGTVYPLYSVSKIFAGVAVMQQVEAGKLDLDAPVGEVLDDVPAELADVALRHALGHTAGLRNFTETTEWKELPADVRVTLAGPDVLAMVAGTPRLFPAGERFAYSQTGFVLAGLVLEQVAGKPYDALLAERVFAPLEMKTARFADPVGLTGEHDSGTYERTAEGPRPKEVRFETFVKPAAGLNASVVDLARFAIALQRGELLSPTSTAELWRESKDGSGKGNGYALGWVADELDGHRRVGHEGGGAAWFWHFPDDRLSLAVLTNLNGARVDALVDDFARRFLTPGGK